MWPWLLSPIGKKVMIGAGIAVVLWGGVKWIEGRAREDEQRKQADKFTQEVEKQRAADRAQVEEVLNAAQAKQEEAERRMQQSLDREAGLVRTIQTLGQQRAAAVTQVSGISDSAIHGFNVQQLGLRRNGEQNACFSISEERAIAAALTQYPLCQKQVEAQNAQIAEVKNQVTALIDKTAALETKFDTLSAYTTRLEGYYVTVYNAIPRKKRSAKCIWLWNCGKRPPLPVPAPIDLHKPTP
jgi:hypothetical protein